MRSSNLKFKLFTRRLFILSAIKTALLGSLIGRLYYLQVTKAENYRTLADGNRIKLALIPPKRGLILDRYGNALALNQTHYRVLLEKASTKQRSETIERLASIINLTETSKTAILKKAISSRTRFPLLISGNMSWNDVAKVAVNSTYLPGIAIDKGMVRYYPFGELFSHIIGYVGQISENETKNNQFLNHADIRVGKLNIEKTQELKLQGTAGFKKQEVNAYGVTIRELSRDPGKPGSNISLTIDTKLQEFTARRLNDAAGSAVIIDIESGEILSMYSSPSFDANQFISGISDNYWQELNNDPYLPLVNKPIAGLYPPGSTFKIVVALAALHEGIPASTIINCQGYFTLGDRNFRCWRHAGHGPLNMIQAISYSCNPYFYTLGKKLGIDKISHTAAKLGLGQKFLPELTGVKRGTNPSKKWKSSTYGKEWTMSDTLNCSIGQGYTLMTPLQMAVMVARIASGGRMIEPHLILNSEQANYSHGNPQFHKDHIEAVKAGMFGGVNNPGGTTFRSKIHDPKYAMAGKTGTGQVIAKKTIHTDNNTNKIWKYRNHSLFVGYAPAYRPKYACSVAIDHGGGGGSVAAPIARDLLLKVQKLNEN